MPRPRRFTVLLALVGVCAGGAVVAQAPTTPSWGIFEKLAGQELKSSDGGYTLRFSWVRPGEELLQEWIHPRTGKVMGASVVVRDAATGQLREGKTAEAAAKGYLGKPGVDGSLDFLKGSSGYRWQLSADGFVERADLKLAGGNVIAKPAPSYARWALADPAPALAAQGAAPPAGPIILAGGPATLVPSPAPTPAYPPDPTPPPPPTPTPTPVAVPRVLDLPPGITAPGKLAATAELDAQGRPFRCYAFSVPPGTRVKISMSSREFPPLLRLAPGSHCGSAKVSGEAQGQQGRAQLSAVLAAGGNHVLLVGSGTAGSTGRFLVSLESEGTVAGAGVPAAQSRVAAMQAQTAAYQAELDRRAKEAQQRREREEQEAREAAAERRAEEERRAANFKRALEELGNAMKSVPR